MKNSSLVAGQKITEKKVLNQIRTIYKEQCYTETKDVAQTCLYPVTSYRAESYWVGRWNPTMDG